MQMDRERLESQIGALEARIDEAIIKARRNEIADLSFMDGDTARMCREAVRIGADADGVLEGKLIAVINRLDELADELRAYKERAAAERKG